VNCIVCTDYVRRRLLRPMLSNWHYITLCYCFFWDGDGDWTWLCELAVLDQVRPLWMLWYDVNRSMNFPTRPRAYNRRGRISTLSNTAVRSRSANIAKFPESVMMDLLNARSMVKKTSLQVRDNNHQSASRRSLRLQRHGWWFGGCTYIHILFAINSV